MTHQQRSAEFYLLSYVPQLLKGESRNFAILGFERSSGYAQVRFVRSAEALRALDPDADLEMLDALYREIEERFQDPDDANAFLHTMLDSFSNTIQISCVKKVPVADDPNAQLDQLNALYR